MSSYAGSNAPPECFRWAFESYQSSPATYGESGAQVLLLQRESQPALYLKSGDGNVADSIISEMVRLRWLACCLPVPRIRQFFYSDGQAWLLTTALPGRSAHQCLASGPADKSEIVRAIAEFLRAFHSLPLADCPFNSDHHLRMAEARRNIDSGQVNTLDFNPCRRNWTVEQVWTEMHTLLPPSFERVVTHGDFSLDNLFLENGRVTGCFDVARAGAADPYQDLAILWDNLGEFGSELQATLFTAYGIKNPDMTKLNFYLCLDEFF